MAQAPVIGSVGNGHSMDSWKSKWPGNAIVLYFVGILGAKNQQVSSLCSRHLQMKLMPALITRGRSCAECVTDRVCCTPHKEQCVIFLHGVGAGTEN